MFFVHYSGLLRNQLELHILPDRSSFCCGERKKKDEMKLRWNGNPSYFFNQALMYVGECNLDFTAAPLMLLDPYC